MTPSCFIPTQTSTPWGGYSTCSHIFNTKYELHTYPACNVRYSIMVNWTNPPMTTKRWSGLELATWWLRVMHPNHYAIITLWSENQNDRIICFHLFLASLNWNNFLKRTERGVLNNRVHPRDLKEHWAIHYGVLKFLSEQKKEKKKKIN